MAGRRIHSTVQEQANNELEDEEGSQWKAQWPPKRPFGLVYCENFNLGILKLEAIG